MVEDYRNVNQVFMLLLKLPTYFKCITNTFWPIQADFNTSGTIQVLHRWLYESGVYIHTYL